MKGKVALVAGASQGWASVGVGITREGAKVAICARGETALKETADTRKQPAASFTDVADMKADDIRKFVNDSARIWPHRGIVNNAGDLSGEFMKFTDEVGEVNALI